jgi:hypothetical protein
MATEHPPSAPRTYPYVSIRMFQSTLDIFAKMRPDRIDQSFLIKYGIPDGSALTVISALKSLDIIDEAGAVKKPQMLIRLGNQQQRTAALRELVDATYADLLQQQEIETATVSDIDLYFQYKNMPPTVSVKAARFFMWVAQQAGYTVGEQVQAAPPRSAKVRITLAPNHDQSRRNQSEVAQSAQPTQPTQSAQSAQPTQSVEVNEPASTQTTFTKYEEELLQILLSNMRESKQLPDTELLKEMQKLIASIKGASPPTSS